MVVGPRIWEINFSGEKESNDLRKCPLATENLQFTGDICRMIRIRKLRVCVPKVAERALESRLGSFAPRLKRQLM